MKPINGFTFGTFDSKKFDLEIERELKFTSPERDVELVTLYGVDGDLAVSKDRFKSTEMSFPCRLRLNSTQSVETLAQSISNGLKLQNGWKQLAFSGMPYKVFVGLFTDSYDIERTTATYGKAVLTFKLKPYAYLTSGLVNKTITGSTAKLTEVNRGTRPSKPIIRINGSGDGTIVIKDVAKNASKTYNFKAVDSGLIMDCNLETVTSLDGARSQFQKVTTYPFPTIPVGNYEITYTGAWTSVIVTPRDEVLV